MGFDKGRIVLDHENGCYYSGQTIYGKLIFDQEKAKKIRGIYLKARGFCQVHWTSTSTERVNDQRITRTIPHESYEEYFDRRVYLAGKDNGEYSLNPGHHEFPFECPIPLNCPSSFDGSYGHIRYLLKIIVDRPFKVDQEKEVSVRVICPLDLNLDPYCKERIVLELNESYCCCCMGSGNSETLVKLPVGGYCPGQKIPVEISCNNTSSVEIEKIKIKIYRDTTFHAHTNPDTKEEVEKILEIKKGSVPGNTSRNWSLELDVPAMDVYNVSLCRFIDIDYRLKVMIASEGCHSDSEDSSRIVFGTIPLRGFQDNVQNPLHDQLPQTIPQPIMNQPLPNHSNPYASGNPPYPGGTAPYPSAASPYPGANSPYPYPGANQTPPTATPYPGAHTPHPVTNPPYPSANSPHPDTRPPYPVVAQPHPSIPSPRPPYPVTSPVTAPYPRVTPYPTDISPVKFPIPHDKDGSSLPLLPPGGAISHPSPYATASAPEPSTPDFDGKKPPALGHEMIASPPPYNPSYVDKGADKI